MPAACFDRLTTRFPFLQVIFADSAYAGDKVKQAAPRPVEIVRRSDTAKGFVVLPKRWIVERTLAWITTNRRMARDFERYAQSAAGFHPDRHDQDHGHEGSHGSLIRRWTLRQIFKIVDKMNMNGFPRLWFSRLLRLVKSGVIVPLRIWWIVHYSVNRAASLCCPMAELPADQQNRIAGGGCSVLCQFGRGRPIRAFVGVDWEYVYRRFSSLEHRSGPVCNFRIVGLIIETDRTCFDPLHRTYKLGNVGKGAFSCLCPSRKYPTGTRSSDQPRLFQCRFDERCKQRMRLQRTRLQFGWYCTPMNQG